MKVRVKPLRASETEGVLTLSQALSPGCFHFQKRSERALRMDHCNADLGEKNMTHVQGIRIFNPCISLLSPREGKRCFSLWRKWQQTPPPLGHWWKGTSWDKERSRHYSLLLGEGQKCAWCPQLHKGRGKRLGKDTVLRPRDLIPATEAYKENAPLPIPHTTKQVSSSNW